MKYFRRFGILVGAIYVVAVGFRPVPGGLRR